MPPTWVQNQPLGIYEWYLIKCRIWYMNGSIFKIFSNFSQNWLKFKKILEKLGDFAQNLANWYMNGSLSWKIGICMGLLSNFAAPRPYQNQTWVPPRVIIILVPWSYTVYLLKLYPTLKIDMMSLQSLLQTGLTQTCCFCFVSFNFCYWACKSYMCLYICKCYFQYRTVGLSSWLLWSFSVYHVLSYEDYIFYYKMSTCF